jgi:uncharacterized protein YcnI
MKSAFMAAAAAGFSLVALGAAHAHVTANPNEAPAGGYFRTALRVGHGCGGTATTAVRVKMPDGVLSVRPQAKPGWTIEIKLRKLDKPVEIGHGRTVTETVDEIAWRGGPLPDAHFDEFGLSMQMPKRPNQTLYFPVVQECEQGVHRWIEIPAAGQKWDDLKEPAPFVQVTEPPPRR